MYLRDRWYGSEARVAVVSCWRVQMDLSTRAACSPGVDVRSAEGAKGGSDRSINLLTIAVKCVDSVLVGDRKSTRLNSSHS